MTCHWIDETTLLRGKAVLACKRLIGKHTFDVLAKTMNEIHMEFGIESKIEMTVTDNGSNFVKAFR